MPHAAALLVAMTLAAAAGRAAAPPPPRPIEFARGASSAEVHGAIARGQAAYYRFAADEGQWAEVTIGSVEDNAVVAVYSPGWRLSPDGDLITVEGEALAPEVGEGADAAGWSGLLPERGTYLVVIGSTRGGAEYDLELAIRAPTDEDCDELPQQPMNRCTGAMAQQAERERVAAERALAQALAPERRAAAVAAEAAWKAYRDAQCELAAAAFEGGSLQPTIYNSCVTGLTRERLEAVRRLAEGEGG